MKATCFGDPPMRISQAIARLSPTHIHGLVLGKETVVSIKLLGYESFMHGVLIHGNQAHQFFSFLSHVHWPCQEHGISSTDQTVNCSSRTAKSAYVSKHVPNFACLQHKLCIIAILPSWPVQPPTHIDRWGYLHVRLQRTPALHFVKPWLTNLRA